MTTQLTLLCLFAHHNLKTHTALRVSSQRQPKACPGSHSNNGALTLSLSSTRSLSTSSGSSMPPSQYSTWWVRTRKSPSCRRETISISAAMFIRLTHWPWWWHPDRLTLTPQPLSGGKSWTGPRVESMSRNKTVSHSRGSSRTHTLRSIQEEASKQHHVCKDLIVRTICILWECAPTVSSPRLILNFVHSLLFKSGSPLLPFPPSPLFSSSPHIFLLLPRADYWLQPGPSFSHSLYPPCWLCD